MPVHKSWQHFLTVESDFAETARFVEIAPANFSTYSVEYSRILLAACSEVDVLCKRLCKARNGASNADNINEYRTEIANFYPDLHTSTVLVPRYEMDRKPWSKWSGATNPDWWGDYNKVKHQRDVHFNKATLINALDAVAALFVMVLYVHNAERSAELLEPEPRLLHLDDEPGLLALESDYKLPGFL
jgi:hypothetical protein